jgi:hypothetical protein
VTVIRVCVYIRRHDFILCKFDARNSERQTQSIPKSEYIFKYKSETKSTLEKTEDVYGSHYGVIIPVVSNRNRE